MKAITVCQPNAHLIIHGDVKGERKRVENRTWMPPLSVIGTTIAIHAGKSRDWLGTDALPDPPDMVFGAVLGTVRVMAWLHIDDLDEYVRRWPAQSWLYTHRHVLGPRCWILDDPRPLARPLPIAGKQRFWELPCHVVRDIADQLR